MLDKEKMKGVELPMTEYMTDELFTLLVGGGFDLMGAPRPRADARCRDPKAAEAEFARRNADQPLSRQVMRARRRKGLPQ